jgi:protein required for attachment to host cells
MTTAWILVANASEAKIFSNKGIGKGMEVVAKLSHPDSRKKASELVTDRPGHNPGTGNGHGAHQPATDPKQHEHDVFARELAQQLDLGRTANSYQRLIVVAEPHFRGLLKNAMNTQVNNLVSDAIDKDYTKLTDKELASHLEKVIYL